MLPQVFLSCVLNGVTRLAHIDVLSYSLVGSLACSNHNTDPSTSMALTRARGLVIGYLCVLFYTSDEWTEALIR